MSALLLRLPALPVVIAVAGCLLVPCLAYGHGGGVRVSTLPAAGFAEASAPPEGAMSLAPGQSRFWLGGQIEDGLVSDPSLCDIVAPCPSWDVVLPQDGHRLRVAIDTPSREDGFRLEVLDAAGAVVASGSASNQFNGEAFLARPKAGRYTVRVVPENATDAFFRLRIKLETAPMTPKDPKRALLPNLKAVPPYEFTFTAPANPANGLYPPDTVNPPLAAAGYEPVSCAPDELAPVAAGGQGAIDCLRLTSGPINVGDGPFVKRFTLDQDLASGAADPATLRGPAAQTIYHADGSTSTRPAGTYSFHTTHAHFHDDGILTYELFRVREGRDGTTLIPAGIGTKSGFCPADQLFGEWRQFTQDPTGRFSEGDTATGSCFSPTDGAFALTRGWGDVYRWQRPGQFVEWAGNADGYFVVRTTVDKGNVTLESDEADNSSYALIQVTGRRIETIERGQGLSHLDPRREVFTGFGPASQDPFGGDVAPVAASRAPRDTVAPRLSRLRLRAGVVSFRLDEAARVRLTLARTTAGGRLRAVGVMTVRARAGTSRRRVGPALRRALRRTGRYTLGAVARDTAGNARVGRSQQFRVR